MLSVCLSVCHSCHINSHPEQLAVPEDRSSGSSGFCNRCGDENDDLDFWELENVKNVLGSLSLQENLYAIYREKQMFSL